MELMGVDRPDRTYVGVTFHWMDVSPSTMPIDTKIVTGFDLKTKGDSWIQVLQHELSTVTRWGSVQKYK